MGKPEKPEVYGKCRIEREIGRGAASTVYLAWHETLQISVALKVIQKEEGLQDASLSRRVMREAHIAAQLTHPNMVRIYDCGETEDAYYLVLEYIEGENCQEKLDKYGPFEWREAASIIRQAVEGLLHAHQRGVIHRDLKPQNIMIDGEGNARIADLGLAKVAATRHPSETLGGDVLGTAYYMSPEQVKQPGGVDFRSDIYSIGATLYHMVTGQPPFDAPTPFEVMAKHLDAALVSPREIVPGLPDALCGVIMRAMAKDPRERHQSYEELVRDLDNLLKGEPVEATAVEEPPEPPVEMAPDSAIEEILEGQPGALELVVEQPATVAPIEAERLPVTVEDVQAKMMGLISLLMCAFFVVWLYRVLMTHVALAAALAATAGMVIASGLWSCIVFRRGDGEADAKDTYGVRKSLKATMARLCERLGLPVPRLHVSERRDSACYAYGFSARSASVDVPVSWLKKAVLSQAETEALLAQGLGGLYNGDSNIRTLLALPTEVLKALRSFLEMALRFVPSEKPKAGLWLLGCLTVAGIVGICGVLVLLFWASFWAGILGLLLVGLMLVTAGFERSCRYAEDAFAAQVTGSKQAVESLVAVSGLAGVDGWLLRRELARAAGAADGSGWPTQTEARRLVDSVVSHYSAASYSAGILDRIRLLFSPVPFAAERLNQLAGLRGARFSAAEAVTSARRMFASLAGWKDKEPMYLRELSGVCFYEAVGIIEGVAALVLLALLLPWGVAHYAGFLGLLAALGSASGLLLAALLLPRRLSAGRFGWTVVVTSVFFTCTSMVGLCLSGGKTLSLFALHFPVFLVLVGFFAFLIGAVVARVWETAARRFRFGGDGARGSEAEAASKPVHEQGAEAGTQAPEKPSDHLEQ